jgi:hypothetical protein
MVLHGSGSGQQVEVKCDWMKQIKIFLILIFTKNVYVYITESKRVEENWMWIQVESLQEERKMEEALS